MEPSYFNPKILQELVAELERHNGAPPWLAEALSLLGKHAELFPAVSDPARYTVEFIYPH